MNKQPEASSLWKCPKCGRQFARHGQSHSCKAYPIELHFVGKQNGKILYEKLKNAIEKEIGPIKIESLECCIHFVNTFTFAAVKILKNKITVDFALKHETKNDRIKQIVPMSAHRFLYVIDIYQENEIDQMLIEYIKEASQK